MQTLNDKCVTNMFTKDLGWCNIFSLFVLGAKSGEREATDAKMLRCMDSCGDGWGANKPITDTRSSQGFV